MTFSILARDPATGDMGGAAATGNLCVGGWVLRGDIRSGLTASQGYAPSTFWGEDGLALMRAGRTAEQAVVEIVAADPGRDWRQLAALDRDGGRAAFDGARNTGHCGHLLGEDCVVVGNWITGPEVLEAIRDGFAAHAPFASRLLAALRAGARAGGDSRGLLSAALLCLHPDRPPLSLRIDHDADPLAALDRLRGRSESERYHRMLAYVPVLSAPHRAPPAS